MPASASSHASTSAPNTSVNSARRILLASLAGTTIEFFDFYIFATAAALVFPKLFFPGADHTASVLKSFATFAIAFVARPVGSALFGHFGDRIGRKATLVAALLTMGLSTILIGFLPTYATIGAAAPLLLSLCRLGQGLGLGGEWGGAVLLATENAPPGKRAWYGMFPQLGAPLGLLCSSLIFLGLSKWLDNDAFLAWGWRLPFLASSLLVFLGLYVRLKIAETPAFAKAMARQERDHIPMRTVFTKHLRPLVLGTFASVATFLLFYLLVSFCLSWGTDALHFNRNQFLIYQMIGDLFFAITIPLSALYADKMGRRRTLIGVSIAIAVFGLCLGPLFGSGMWGAIATEVIGFALMGVTYGPLGTFLSELFPTAVRYTGSSIAFNMAGILGAAFAPSLALKLATSFGLFAVGLYLVVAAVVSLLAVLLGSETRHVDFDGTGPSV